MTSFDRAKQIALTLPDVEESTSYGTPALKVRGKLIARRQEDNETLVLRTSWDERARLLALRPETFFLTDQYRKQPWVLLRLKVARVGLLTEALADAWKQSAPRALVSARCGVPRD